MRFKLVLTAEAKANLATLEADAGLAIPLKAVRKALARLEVEPNYPALNVHPWQGKMCPHNKTLFEAYAQNKTPGAYRIFFCYVPEERGTIMVVSITAHP